jgi:hypothetical protein
MTTVYVFEASKLDQLTKVFEGPCKEAQAFTGRWNAAEAENPTGLIAFADVRRYHELVREVEAAEAAQDQLAV